MIRVGIGGWVFEPWRGTFYPKGLPHVRELAHGSGITVLSWLRIIKLGDASDQPIGQWNARDVRCSRANAFACVGQTTVGR